MGMKFGGVDTNIETQEQYELVIRRIIEWYVGLRYPNYKVVKIENKKKEVAREKRKEVGNNGGSHLLAK